jgi:hypothetical protein
MEVFANRTEKRDFVVNEFERRATEECEVYIATAFFTELSVVRRLVEKRCRIYLVVRLGFPTDPDAIERAMTLPGVQLRVYTGRSFHPKLYIFSDDTALVGSANLTHQAITSNQEVVVAIGSADTRFTELVAIFDDYWQGADVPTKKQLEDYKQLYLQYAKHANATDKLEREALEKLGDKSPANIERGQRKDSKASLFLAGFRRTYQESVAAFEIVRRAYAATGYRKADASAIPLRLEIDSFISFVRERHAVGESWQTAPYRTPTEQESLIRVLVEEWSRTYWRHFEKDIVETSYPALKRVFASFNSVKAANDDDLFQALTTLHSFHDRLRFFDGGLSTLKREFFAANQGLSIRDSLAYLTSGDGDIVERMAALIFSSKWKLAEFGRANVQELVGWCNQEELPVINGRTTMVLRYFGSRVKQV